VFIGSIAIIEQHGIPLVQNQALVFNSSHMKIATGKLLTSYKFDKSRIQYFKSSVL